MILLFNYIKIKKDNKNIHILNEKTDNENKIIENKNEELKKQLLNLNEEANYLETLNAASKKQEQETLDRLENIKDKVDKAFSNQKALSQKAFEQYFELLNNDYEKKTIEYDKKIDVLKESYSQQQKECLAELSRVQDELASIKSTRDATRAAALKEKEIKEKLSFYCLSIPESEKNDIQALESIRPRLNKPRVLSMLIWSTFYQKRMNELCNNVLGTSIVTGIYKITNQKTDMCYIGQSVDLASRWKQHAKCGLGIDTPQGNKLYKDMLEYGLDSYSWELLEECPREKLDEKEKYYINLYDAYNYGFNSTKGNK